MSEKLEWLAITIAGAVIGNTAYAIAVRIGRGVHASRPTTRYAPPAREIEQPAHRSTESSQDDDLGFEPTILAAMTAAAGASALLATNRHTVVFATGAIAVGLATAQLYYYWMIMRDTFARACLIGSALLAMVVSWVLWEAPDRKLQGLEMLDESLRDGFTLLSAGIGISLLFVGAASMAVTESLARSSTSSSARSWLFVRLIPLRTDERLVPAIALATLGLALLLRALSSIGIASPPSEGQ